MKDTQNAQDRFLTEMIKERRNVAVFLVSGIKLEGKIIAFDDYVIIVHGAMEDQVYKHAVSTVQPVTDGLGISTGKRHQEKKGHVSSVRPRRGYMQQAEQRVEEKSTIVARGSAPRPVDTKVVESTGPIIVRRIRRTVHKEHHE
jgi:host factor-I protein